MSDKQPRNFGMGVRFKNSISGTANTKSPTTPGTNEYVSSRIDKPGNKSHVEGRGHSKNFITERRVFEQSVSGSQKRWGKQASNEFKKVECFRALPTFQNGRLTSSKRDVPSSLGLRRDPGLIMFNYHEFRGAVHTQVATLNGPGPVSLSKYPPTILTARSKKPSLGLNHQYNVRRQTVQSDIACILNITSFSGNFLNIKLDENLVLSSTV